MTLHPEGTSARSTAIALLVFVLMTSGLLGVREYRSYKLDLTSKRDLVRVESKKLIHQINEMRSAIENVEVQDIEPFIWSGDQAGTLIATVQAAVGELARENGIRLRSIAPTTASGFGNIDATGLRLEGEAKYDMVLKFLKHLETHTPALLIQKGTLRRLNRAGGPTEYPIVFFQVELAAPIRIAGLVK